MKIKYKKIIINILLLFFFSSLSFSAENFDSIKKKKTSYLDFILLKLENRLINKSRVLGPQSILVTRVQYSRIGIQVNFNQKDKKILIVIKGIMDKRRYAKKPYNQKISDCNQVRNLILYNKSGYSLFTQKRTNILSEGEMEEIFKKEFLYNLSLTDKEVEHLLNNIFMEVAVINPVTKKSVTCSGKVYDWELL